MKFIKNIFNSARPHFKEGGKYEKLDSLFQATETFFFIPADVTKNDAHIRDNLDLKRFMSVVIIALLPVFFFGLYNAGYQSNLASGRSLEFVSVFTQGLWIVLPLVIVSYGVGFFWELLFAVVRKKEISEGFLVTGLLFPMTLPPTIPLWQAAIGISFGVVIGKEIFGGTGRNILNPALTGRAFLFFAYPARMSGDSVWTVVDGVKGNIVDAVSAATPLSCASGAVETVSTALEKGGYTLSKLFFGLYPGSIGETSVLLCLVGAFILIVTGIGSYRIILGGILGMVAFVYPVYLFNLFTGNTTPAMLSIHPGWHLSMGGFAFGITFMATDPVSAPGMEAARWIYGFAIGALTILIRVFNPAYPEGVMLAILFMNIFAPLLDHLVIKSRLKKRIPNV
ncbi:NADH:ubiquinone reductase (Na(+)-transporting) subunit B [Desulfobacterales bacterium HSG16]|nr:NADH:ubiquinone reductase (Na(+)-transporting) subunit B [Desulfobacterales bacterium HSG16]